MKKILPTLCVLLSCCLPAIPAGSDTDRSKPPLRQMMQKEQTADLGKEQGYLETRAERALNVLYKQVLQRKLYLDLYYPTANRAARCPVILYTHGGGWAAGSRHGVTKALFEPLFLKLLEKGFCVAAVDYRLCKKGSGIYMRDCVIDCKDAARYLAKNAGSLGLDPARFCVMGDSAGGHIAQMLLLSSPESLPGDAVLVATRYRMVAGVSWYGPCDFERMDLFNYDDRPGFRDRFAARILKPGATAEEKLGRYREMSPVNHLGKHSPPLLMIQGDGDTTIPVKHAYYMKEKAEAVGAPVEIMIVKNAGHNWRKAGGDVTPSREEIVERTLQFFVEHCQPQAETP